MTLNSPDRGGEAVNVLLSLMSPERGGVSRRISHLHRYQVCRTISYANCGDIQPSRLCELPSDEDVHAHIFAYQRSELRAINCVHRNKERSSLMDRRRMKNAIRRKNGADRALDRPYVTTTTAVK